MTAHVPFAIPLGYVLPDSIRAAFQTKALQPFGKIADQMGIEVETLSSLVKRFKIPTRIEGVGRAQCRTLDLDSVQTLWNAIERAARPSA